MDELRAELRYIVSGCGTREDYEAHSEEWKRGVCNETVSRILAVFDAQSERPVPMGWAIVWHDYDGPSFFTVRVFPTRSGAEKELRIHGADHYTYTIEPIGCADG